MKQELIQELKRVFRQCEGNHVMIAETEDQAGAKLDMFDEPLIGFASASDSVFEDFKNPEVIGPFYQTPKEWLPEAKTVISFFLPFTEQVRVSNRADKELPSIEWLYSRIEGQSFITDYMRAVADILAEQGMKVCVPSSDPRFGVIRDEIKEGDTVVDFHVESKWSERHAAYACGLGTFGLSRGLITKSGMAGRYASIIIDAEIEPDERPYTGVYDYCTRCGACIHKCPVKAISLEYGKNNIKCSNYVDLMGERFSPRYGCGKCQTGVPCENRIPAVK